MSTILFLFYASGLIVSVEESDVADKLKDHGVEVYPFAFSDDHYVMVVSDR